MKILVLKRVSLFAALILCSCQVAFGRSDDALGRNRASLRPSTDHIGNLPTQQVLNVGFLNIIGFQPYLMSPYVLDSAVTMAYLASKGNTARELREFYYSRLGLGEYIRDLSGCCGVKVSPAFGLFVSKSLVEDRNLYFSAYQRRLREYFGEHFHKAVVVDFSNHHINEYVAHETNDNVQDFIDSGTLSPNSSAILVSSLGFEGKWLREYRSVSQYSDWSPFGGRNSVFFAVDEHYQEFIESDIYYMEAIEPCTDYFCYGYLKTSVPGLEEDLTIFEVPFADTYYSMIFFMPAKPNDNKILFDKMVEEPDLFNKLVQKMYRNKTMNRDTLFISRIPYFTLENYTVDMSGPVKDLGADDIFSDEANLSYISGQTDIKLDAILHKNCIRITQFGVGVGAASADLGVFKASNNNDTIEVNINRPFWFQIRAKHSDQSKDDQVLFFGGMNEVKSLQNTVNCSD